LGSRVDSDDTVLVTIGAHGGVGYFVDYYGAMFTYSELHGLLNLLPSSKIAVILEACYCGSGVDEFQYSDGYVVLAGCDNNQECGGALLASIIEGMTLPLPVDLDADFWVSAEELWAYADPLARAFDPTLRPQIWDGVTEMTRAPGFTTEIELFEIRRCFIATAAYGTPMAPQIDILRDFRDQYLLTNPVGEALVEFYYKVSPPMAEFITEHPALKPVVRAGLVPAVAMSTVAVKTTSAEKMAILGSLALVCIALAIWVRERARRRGRGR